MKIKNKYFGMTKNLFYPNSAGLNNNTNNNYLWLEEICPIFILYDDIHKLVPICVSYIMYVTDRSKRFRTYKV